MSTRRICLGFGFQPEQSQHHILVSIPKKKDSSVVIYERFSWKNKKDDKESVNLSEEDKAKAEISTEEDKAKAEISRHKWELLEETFRLEFNNRLKKQKLPAGRFIVGQTPLDRMLGKELLVLVWAVEDCDPSNVPVAIRNWLGLAPEERWWLYTMTNAATGNIEDRRGWRKALRYALCENPIDEKQKQMQLFDAILKQEEER